MKKAVIGRHFVRKLSLKICFAVVILLLASFCGCNKQQKEPELSSGSYMLNQYEGAYMSPVIKLDTEKNTFSFHYDYLSSYYAYGKFTVSGSKVVAETDDGKYTYVFQIKDDETIVFVQKGSSEIKILDEKAQQVIDGSEFRFLEE